MRGSFRWKRRTKAKINASEERVNDIGGRQSLDKVNIVQTLNKKFGLYNNVPSAITQPFFELQTPDFVWNFG